MNREEFMQEARETARKILEGKENGIMNLVQQAWAEGKRNAEAETITELVKQAFDKVQQKDAVAVKSSDKWFLAKTLLPEEDCDVLVYNGLGLEIAAYTTNPVPKWYGRDGHQVYAMFWRFLPEPPKEVIED